MDIFLFILEKILEIYMTVCTIVITIIVLLWFFGRRHLEKIKKQSLKIDKRIFNNENKTVN